MGENGMALPPGFRFHPTDEELVGYYLRRKVDGLKIELEVIPVIDLYKYDPWELPDKSFLPKRDMEWFFFCPRDRKYPNGTRTNRATGAGYWKATGKDRKVVCQPSVTGLRKTLVFYRGRAPAGDRTDWVMHEYRLCEELSQGTCSFRGAFALCRVVKKNEQVQKMSDTQGEPKAKRFNSFSLKNDFLSSITGRSILQISEESQSPHTCASNGSSSASPIASPSQFGGEFDLLQTSVEPDGIDHSVPDNLTLGTFKDLEDAGQISSKYLLFNEMHSSTRTWEQCSNMMNFSCASSINTRQQVDRTKAVAQIGQPYHPGSCYEMAINEMTDFPSFEWAESPVMNPFSDGFEAMNPTPPLCRQSSGDGMVGDGSSLWLRDDNLVIMI